MWPSPEPATLTITTSARSAIEIPVRRAGVDDPPVPGHFSEPEAAPAPAHTGLRNGASEERSLLRDARTGLTRIVAELAHFPPVRLADSGLEYEERAVTCTRSIDGEPLSALSVSERLIAISRGRWRNASRRGAPCRPPPRSST